MKNLESIIQEKKDRIISEFEKNKLTTFEIITKVVDSTTIRAYTGNKKYKPLSIYRVWAKETLANEKKCEIIKSWSDFKKIHDYFHDDFKKFWLKVEGKKLMFYKINKIIDLFFKGIAEWDELENERRIWFFNNANVPIDKYTLKYLRTHTHSAEIKRKIQKNPSMGNIGNKVKLYDTIQKEIRKLCNGEAPYIFETLAQEEGRGSSDSNIILEPIKKKRIKVA